MKTRVFLKYFVDDCLWKMFFASNKLDFFDNFASFKIFNTVLPIIRATNLQNVLKFFLLYNYLSDLFTAVQIWYWRPFKFGLGRVFGKKNVFPAKLWLFLTSAFVNKDIKSKRTFCRQSWSYYFETFWCLTEFSFHQKSMCMYVLPEELLHNLRLRILEN